MCSEKINLKLTEHAQEKILQRNIDIEKILKVVSAPEIMEIDRFDRSLIHFIGKFMERYLRVIGRWEEEKTFLVISAFYDRRFRRRDKNDKI